MEEKNLMINASDCLGIYSGQIKITTVDKYGNQKGKAKYFKNNGRWPLFQFFTTCLLGKYNTAEPMRPKYIKLFTAGNEGDVKPEITDDESSQRLDAFLTSDKERSMVTYSYNTEPTDTKDEGVNLGQAAITYKFTIPYTHIDTSEDINLICLYNTTNYNTLTEPSAYFFVTDSTGTKLGSLLQKETGKVSKNYNLIVEWTLTLKNIEKE